MGGCQSVTTVFLVFFSMYAFTKVFGVFVLIFWSLYLGDASVEVYGNCLFYHPHSKSENKRPGLDHLKSLCPHEPSRSLRPQCMTSGVSERGKFCSRMRKISRSISHSLS